MNAQGLEVMYELRVLSGLHQGAVLPLMGERWSIGASDEADLALYDPGIESMHAHLYYRDGHWSLQAQEGLLHDETGAVLAHIADLQPGNGFSIGCIRLCLDHAESDWPAEPEHRPGLPSEPGLVPPIKLPAKHWKKLLTGALALLLLVFAGIALLAPDELQEPTLAALQQSEKRALATAQDVHRQLQQMLRERELQTLIGFNVEPHQVTLNGEVFKEQLALISRMLDRFQVQFSTPVAIINRVRETDSAPPFTIVQIMGGKKAHVVFADGRRLFYGDEIDGLRLTLIDNHRMLFEGKQRYEVSW